MRGVAPLAWLDHPELVPASLLPPDDPTRLAGRTVRDWLVDVVMFVAAVLIGLAALGTISHEAVRPVPDGKLVLDLALGSAACLALWWRRHWPVGVAAVTITASAFSSLAVLASLLAVFTVGVHRRTGIAALCACCSAAAALGYAWWVPVTDSLVSTVIVPVAAAAIAVAWGMFVRARRQLVWSLHERAQRAEAEQRLHTEQARTAERARIAREMHDVLAHRISLLALHAGALELRPDLPGEQVAETATLLRGTARQALEELRDVIGVLRDELPARGPERAPGRDPERGGGPPRPQPTLRDLPRLIAERRDAGAKIDYSSEVVGDVPNPLGRDAYRIVQEALTNVAKHAPGTATTVHVSGGPAVGLDVCVRNPLPVGGGEPVLPGSGRGLIGLAERVGLAGGTFRHGSSGDFFVVEASLPWG
jgi:signal transduction histidine kinase